MKDIDGRSTSIRRVARLLQLSSTILFALVVRGEPTQPPPTPASGPALAAKLPSGRVGKYEVTVTGTERMAVWAMMPGNDFMPKFEARPGNEMLVVKFDVMDMATGKPDDRGDAHFSDFNIESTEQKKFSSPVKSTDLREVPFEVPTGTRLQSFTIQGTTIPLAALAADDGKSPAPASGDKPRLTSDLFDRILKEKLSEAEVVALLGPGKPSVRPGVPAEMKELVWEEAGRSITIQFLQGRANGGKSSFPIAK